ncbi:MAG: PAS domain S-box protein [Alphaproteobacteria bacterium]
MNIVIPALLILLLAGLNFTAWKLLHGRALADDGMSPGSGGEIVLIPIFGLVLSAGLAFILYGFLNQRTALRASERRFQDITQMSADWFATMDADLRLTYVSDGVAKVGGTPKNMLGKTRQELAFDHLGPDAIDAEIKAMNAHEPYRDIVRQSDINPERWLQVNGKPIFDAKGRFQGFHTAYTDITELMRAQENLTDSEQRFRDYANSASDWLWESDEEFRLTRMTGPIEDTGRDPGARIGKTRWEYTADPDTDNQKWRDHKADLVAHRPFRDFQMMVHAKDGGIRHGSTSGLPVFDEAGVFKGYRGVGTDITELKVAEAALKSSEKNFRLLVEQSHQGIYIHDDLRPVFVNEALASLFGYDNTEEVMALPGVDVLIAPHERERLYDYAAARGRGDAVPDWYEVEGMRKDGTPIWLQLHAQHVVWEGKKRLSSTFVDLTSLRMVEQRLREERENADQANRAKSVFLASMSHEFRTPLNAIIGFSELLESEILGPIGNEKYVEYIGDISQSGRHLLALITDVLDVTKIEAEKLELTETPLDISLLAAEVLRLTGQRAEAGEVDVAIDIPPGLPRLMADETRTKQIVMNLVSNSIKFTPPGGHVVIIAALEGEATNDTCMVISVRDSGMSPKEAEAAMEPFVQIGNVITAPSEGTGLGLFLVKSLMDLHGGTVDIASVPKQGTTISLRFPSNRCA